MAATGLIAGADLATAIRLGISMLALQAAIGALNDVVDAPADAGRKPGKPIPSGLVSRRGAGAVGVGGAVLGLALAVPSGLGLVAIAGLVLAIGVAYDLGAKGTPWSWLPYAVGIPLLPVYGWYGATGSLPGWMLVLVAMAALAGAALAIANTRADLERDLDAGTASVATALGLGRSWWVELALWLVAGAIAVGTARETADRGPVGPPILAIGLVIVLAGVWIGRAGPPGRRQRAWEVQAIGAAVAAVGWLLAVGIPA